MENTNEIYACAYKEVITILSFLPDSDWNKIPKERRDFFFENMDKDYEFNLDYSKPINEQSLLKETDAILASIFKKYIATAEKKRQILKEEKQEFEELEAEKRRKYNPENIFKNQTITTAPIQNEPVVTETAMIEYKETVFDKIKNWFKRTFGNKNEN